MDERKPLIEHHFKDRKIKNPQQKGWDNYQFVWIILSLTCYSSAAILSVPFTTQYVYSRVAEEHNVNTSGENTVESPCNASTNNSTDLDDIQAESTQWMLMLSLTVSVPCLFVNIFFGAHADSWGRKPYFIIPTLGGLLRGIIVIAIVQWNLPVYVMVISSVVEGISGSFFIFLVASFSCIADMTNESKSRTFFIAVIQGVSGSVSGLLLIGSGYFIRSTGFLYPAVTISAIYALGLLVQCCLLKETLKKHTIISVKRRLQTVVLFFSEDEHRLMYIICLITFFLQGLTNIGKSNVVTLFAMNEPFCFSTVKIGWLSSAAMVVPAFGGILLLKLLQCCLSDKTIVIVSILSNGGSMVLQGLARYEYQIYLVPFAGVMGMLVYSLLRGIVSRITDPKHQGALFGAFGTVEVLSYLFSSLLLNLIYEKTVDVFPGAVFLILAGISGIMLLLFMIVVLRKTPTTKMYDEIKEVTINS